jgi:bifunctional DNA-binding transcriptional regulator/antitoxin component of YhaV-PrlF toxin-antitoxin module
MELAKITTCGQITLPVGIRKKLGVTDSDQVIFGEENGRVVIENTFLVELKQVQDVFRGEAKRLGLKTEQDVVDLVKEVRRQRWEERNAAHA